jgi:hypothetical protein
MSSMLSNNKSPLSQMSSPTPPPPSAATVFMPSEAAKTNAFDMMMADSANLQNDLFSSLSYTSPSIASISAFNSDSKALNDDFSFLINDDTRIFLYSNMHLHYQAQATSNMNEAESRNLISSAFNSNLLVDSTLVSLEEPTLSDFSHNSENFENSFSKFYSNTTLDDLAQINFENLSVSSSHLETKKTLDEMANNASTNQIEANDSNSNLNLFEIATIRSDSLHLTSILANEINNAIISDNSSKQEDQMLNQSKKGFSSFKRSKKQIT